MIKQSCNIRGFGSKYRKFPNKNFLPKFSQMKSTGFMLTFLSSLTLKKDYSENRIKDFSQTKDMPTVFRVRVQNVHIWTEVSYLFKYQFYLSKSSLAFIYIYICIYIIYVCCVYKYIHALYIIHTYILLTEAENRNSPIYNISTV